MGLLPGGIIYTQGGAWYNQSTPPSFSLTTGTGRGSISAAAVTWPAYNAGGNYAYGNAGFQLQLALNSSWGGHFKIQLRVQATSTWSSIPGTCTQTSTVIPGTCLVESYRYVSANAILHDVKLGKDIAYSASPYSFFNGTSISSSCVVGGGCSTSTTGLLHGRLVFSGTETLWVNASLRLNHTYSLHVDVMAGLLAWVGGSSYSTLTSARCTTSMTVSYSLPSLTET